MTESATMGRWAPTLTVLMGTVSVILTTTIVNVAIPSIMADLGMAQTYAQWLSTGFLAAMPATMLASAPVAARLGQRTTFVGALVVFIAASLLAAASWNAEVMIVARVLQGLMAGIISPMGMVVIFQVFPDHERGRALGLYAMGAVLAPALGPALGGVLVDVFNWRAVYLATLPFSVIGLIGARRTLPNVRAATRGPFDWWGLALLGPGIGLLLVGMTRLSGNASGVAATWLLLGAVFLALFVLRQKRALHPLITPDIFRHPQFVLACLLAAVYGAGLFGTTYLLPLLAQGVQAMSATATGLLMMPAGLALAAFLPIAGRLGDRIPAYRLIIVGLLVIAAAMFGLSASGPATGFWLLAGWVLVGRLGMGLMGPSLSLGALRDIPEAMVHQGSGMVNFCRMFGGAVGVNLVSLLLAARVGHYLEGKAGNLQRFYDAGGAESAVSPAALRALTHGFSDTFLVFGCWFVAAVILAAAMGVYRGKLSNDSRRI